MKKLMTCALVALTLALPGCLDFGDTTFVNGQTQGSSPTGPSAVLPTPPPVCSITSLAGGVFGELNSACAGRVLNRIPVGCIVIATVTPILASGEKAAPAVHGQALSIVIVEGGSSGILQTADGDNVFNYTLERTAAGLIRVQATLVPPGCTPITRVYDYP